MPSSFAIVRRSVARAHTLTLSHSLVSQCVRPWRALERHDRSLLYDLPRSEEAPRLRGSCVCTYLAISNDHAPLIQDPLISSTTDDALPWLWHDPSASTDTTRDISYQYTQGVHFLFIERDALMLVFATMVDCSPTMAISLLVRLATIIKVHHHHHTLFSLAPLLSHHGSSMLGDMLVYRFDDNRITVECSPRMPFERTLCWCTSCWTRPSTMAILNAPAPTS